VDRGKWRDVSPITDRVPPIFAGATEKSRTAKLVGSPGLRIHAGLATRAVQATTACVQHGAITRPAGLAIYGAVEQQYNPARFILKANDCALIE
jgi:hypothetical protein